MIQRHVKKTGDLANFDYFNDSQDTLNYLKMEIECTTDNAEKERLTKIYNQLKKETEKFNQALVQKFSK